jgi:hypothetical protein
MHWSIQCKAAAAPARIPDGSVGNHRWHRRVHRKPRLQICGGRHQGARARLARHLDASGPHLEQPINLHFTGCAHSCAQHYCGDIGFMGAKTRTAPTPFTSCSAAAWITNKGIARELLRGVRAEEIPATVSRILQPLPGRQDARRDPRAVEPSPHTQGTAGMVFSMNGRRPPHPRNGPVLTGTESLAQRFPGGCLLPEDNPRWRRSHRRPRC